MSKRVKIDYEEFHKKKVSEKKKFLLTNAEYDCSFVFVNKPSEVGSTEKRLFSYKWMLSAVSPVFQAMFNGNHEESTESSMDIKINDVSFEAFELFLDFIYYGAENVGQWPENYWNELFYIAEKYEMPQMLKDLDVSVRLNADNITSFNWSKACKLRPRLIFREDVITDPRLGEFNLKQFIEFLKSYGCDMWEKQDKKLKIIESYINQKNYNVDETQSDVIVAVGEDNDIVRSSREIVHHLLKSVEFYCMPLKDFLNGPVKSKLLPIEEKHAILRKLLKNELEELKEKAEKYEEFQRHR